MDGKCYVVYSLSRKVYISTKEWKTAKMILESTTGFTCKSFEGSINRDLWLSVQDLELLDSTNLFKLLQKDLGNFVTSLQEKVRGDFFSLLLIQESNRFVYSYKN